MSMDAVAVHAALSATQRPVDLFTGRGTHEGCGECCGRFLPLHPAEVIALRHAAKGLDLRPEEPGTIDMNCPLLGPDNRCMAYDARPAICRAYDCSRHAADAMAFAMEAEAEGVTVGMTIYDMREVLS